MKLNEYTKIKPNIFNNEKMKGVAGRVVIGKSDGAQNFYMRVFEISPGGYTPKHSHDWEHEIFVHSGEGEFFSNGKWHPAKGGDVVFMPGGEEHQIRNSEKDLFVFVCLVPSIAPEL